MVIDSSLSQDAPMPNPDEIIIDDDDLDVDTPITAATSLTDAAQVINPSKLPVAPRNPDEITLDDEEESVAALPPAPPPPSETKFLALDKCLPRREFLEVCQTFF
jgi:lariat debranching enzyme